MSKKPFTDFLTHVLPMVDGCPRNVVISAIRESAIEFCKRSLFDEVDLIPVSLIAGVAEYPLFIDPDRRVAQIKTIRGAGIPLGPVEETYMDAVLPGWQTESGNSPSHYLVLNPGTIRLYPSPSENVSQFITGRVALIPTRDAVNISERVYDEYYEGIVGGALARLMMMKGKSWYAPNDAAVHNKKLNDAISDARIAILKGHSTASLSVHPRTLGD